MKKTFLILSLLCMTTLYPTIGSADARHHDWSHASYRQAHWHHSGYVSYSKMPFRWHEHRNYFVREDYRMERIYEREWQDRFPGLHAYRWQDTRGEGFWYHERRVTDAVFLYDNSNQLVSIGFMHNGAFVLIRDDNRCLESRDSFFFSWWH